MPGGPLRLISRGTAGVYRCPSPPSCPSGETTRKLTTSDQGFARYPGHCGLMRDAPTRRRRPGALPGALRTALARASLRVRVLAAAAVLVAVTSVLMGLLGTVLLRGYLYGRGDTQLRTFSSFSSRGVSGSFIGGVVAHPRPPHPRRSLRQLPTDFLVEVIDASGKAHVAPESRHGIAPPVVPAARLHGPDTPFTAPAADGSGHLWRVVIRAVPGGRHVVTAVSLDDVQSTVGQ